MFSVHVYKLSKYMYTAIMCTMLNSLVTFNLKYSRSERESLGKVYCFSKLFFNGSLYFNHNRIEGTCRSQ